MKNLFQSIVRRLWGINSSRYWETRYAQGGDSGKGSEGCLAQFKADTVNRLVKQYELGSLVELGCGDGRQLAMFEVDQYIGLDVSPTIIQHLQQEFGQSGPSGGKYRFQVYSAAACGEFFSACQADMALSLDVIYHLVEDAVYESYLTDLFRLGRDFVLIYNLEQPHRQVFNKPHVYYREVLPWIADHCPDWELAEFIKNPHSQDQQSRYSSDVCDFFLFQRKDSAGE